MGAGGRRAYVATCLRRERNIAHRGHLMAFVSAAVGPQGSSISTTATRLESSVGGWVCRACNTGVGMVDEIEHLEKRIAFLKAHEKKVGRIAFIKAVHEVAKNQDVACATSCILLLFPLIRATITFWS